MTRKPVGPLRKVIERNCSAEKLECGHVLVRPLGLGEMAMELSKVKSRRCYFCAAEEIRQ